MSDNFNELNEKYSNVNVVNHIDNGTSGIDITYDFDELKMYFGEDFWITDQICIHQPTIGDILEFGDSKFYQIMNILCGNPTTFRLQLWKMGINWNNISDFELFCVMSKSLTQEDTYLIFGDLNFSWFELLPDKNTQSNVLVYLKRDENGNIQKVKKNEQLIIIDEYVYERMVKYLRLMFDINPKVEHAKNKVTAEAIIWEDEMNEQTEREKTKKKGYKKSFLLPLVSGLVNHPGFKYKTSELKELGIVQFMDSVQRLQVYENTTALLKGMYSGFIDGKQIKNEQINWLQDLNK